MADRLDVNPVRDIPTTFMPTKSRRRIGDMAGNHLILASEVGFVLLAHLEQGSVIVIPGSEVSRGQEVAAVGNSGNSLGPHLHMQVNHHPDPGEGRPIPLRFTKFGVGDSDHGKVDAYPPWRRVVIRC